MKSIRKTKNNILRRLVAGVCFLLTVCWVCSQTAAAQGQGNDLERGMKVGHFSSADDTLSIAQEEREALDGYGVLHVIVISGTAPISDVDEAGDYAGIIRILSDHIAELLGVEFQYVVVPSVTDAQKAAAQGIGELFLTAATYASVMPDMTLTTDPLLAANLALFYNTGVQPDELAGKTYAMVEGDTPPESVAEENILLCDNRMEAIEAVNDGRADYGYGNEFSVFYYCGLKDFEHVAVIPTYTGLREYCYGVLNGDPLLRSAINKAIAFLTENYELESIIMTAFAIPPEDIALHVFVEKYATVFRVLAFFLINGTLLLAWYFYRVSRQLSLLNEQYRVIAEISGDLGFGYNVQTKTLRPTRLFCEAFGIECGGKPCGPEALNGILDITEIIDKRISREELTLSDGRVYEAAYAFIMDKHKRPVTVMGNLMDVTKSRKQLSDLTRKAETDGLTGVLNSASVREAIQRRLDEFVPGQTDAMFFIDMNRFKYINDTYGHHMGDLVLVQTAEAIARVMRKQDVVGRLGGDEFIVYAQSIGNPETARNIRSKLYQATNLTLETDGITIESSVSIGCCIISEPMDFETAYRAADKSMYAEKENGTAGYCVSGHVDEGERHAALK